MTRKEFIKLFWAEHPNIDRKRNSYGDYPTDTRIAFCDFVDYAHRSGLLTDKQTQEITLP